MHGNYSWPFVCRLYYYIVPFLEIVQGTAFAKVWDRHVLVLEVYALVVSDSTLYESL